MTADAVVHPQSGAAFELHYLAEGAAHVIYEVRPHPNTTVIDPMFDGKLLRFRKDTGFARTCEQRVDDFERTIAPLFPARNLVKLERHNVSDQRSLVRSLNTSLRRRETDKSRPSKRKGVYLTLGSLEKYHVLVTDMRPRTWQDKMIEFKPKWLVRTASTPATAKRCRTCALRCMKEGSGPHEGSRLMTFCPLDLLSTDPEALQTVFRALEFPEWDHKEWVTVFTAQVRPLLVQLQEKQREHNNVGVDDLVSQPHQDFSLAMALRDCSIFLRLKTDVAMIEDVRIADLDLKSKDGGKLEYWTEIERRLIDEGWYEATETAANSRGQKHCKNLDLSS